MKGVEIDQAKRVCRHEEKVYMIPEKRTRKLQLSTMITADFLLAVCETIQIF